jgi:predicted MFS family arabinose efflux permease
MGRRVRPAVEGLGRGTAALLVDRGFAPYFYAKTISATGIWLGNVAAAVLAYDVSGSPFVVASVTMLQFLGPLVLAPWAGVLTDRVDRRTLLMIGRAISGIAVTPMTVLLLLRGTGGFGGEAMLLAAVLVLGIGFAITSPAAQALIPSLVPPEDLDSALALNASSPSIARTLGPPIGAYLMATGGPGLAFAIVALTQFGFCLSLGLIGPRPPSGGEGRPDILGGFRYLLEDRKAGLLMIGVAALCVGADPMVTLTPPLAAEFGGGSDLVGFFATSFGVGAFAVTAGLRVLRRWMDLRILGVVGFLAMAVGLALCAVPGWLAMPVAGLFVAGAGFMLGNVALTTRIQRRVPDELRGRVMAIWGIAFLGARPVAAGLDGAIAELVSVRVALIAGALVVLASTALARTSYRVRGRESAA